MGFLDIGSISSSERTLKDTYDCLILGGGPGGLTAGIYASRGGLSTLVLEKGMEGGTLNFTPLIENYPPFPEIVGMELVQKWTEHAEQMGVAILREGIVEASLTGETLAVKTDQGRTVFGKTIIISTGSSYRQLGLASERRFAGKGVSYCALCDGALFKNKKIAVVGGGNSAIDEALYLSQIADSVTIIHRRDQLRAEKALAEKALRNPKIRFYWDTVLTDIEGARSVESLVMENVKTKTRKREPFDGVFIYVGLEPRSACFKGALEMTEDGFIITDPDTLETSIDRVFAVGDVRKKEIRQIITAAADGAIAASFIIKKYFL